MRRRALLLLALTACASGARRGPMSEGERTYRSKCTSCHRAYEPADRTPEQWVKTVDKMEALKKVTLTAGERTQILLYLTGDAHGTPQAPLR